MILNFKSASGNYHQISEWNKSVFRQFLLLYYILSLGTDETETVNSA